MTPRDDLGQRPRLRQLGFDDRLEAGFARVAQDERALGRQQRAVGLRRRDREADDAQRLGSSAASIGRGNRRNGRTRHGAGTAGSTPAGTAGTVDGALVLGFERVVDAPGDAGGADQRAGAEKSAVAGQETASPGGRACGPSGPSVPVSTTDNTSVTLFNTAFVPPIKPNTCRRHWEVPQENTNDRYRLFD